MDENGEILLLHASKNNACPLVLPRLDDFACYHSILVCSANSGLKNLLRYTTWQLVGLCKIRRAPPATSSSRSKRGSLHVVRFITCIWSKYSFTRVKDRPMYSLFIWCHISVHNVTSLGIRKHLRFSIRHSYRIHLGHTGDQILNNRYFRFWIWQPK